LQFVLSTAAASFAEIFLKEIEEIILFVLARYNLDSEGCPIASLRGKGFD